MFGEEVKNVARFVNHATEFQRSRGRTWGEDGEGYGIVSSRRNQSSEIRVSEKRDCQGACKMCPEVGGEYSSVSGSDRIVDVTCSLWSLLPIPLYIYI